MTFNQELKASGRIICNDSQPYIVAEMACAHNGSIEEAKAIIDAAVAAKADAVQLQFFVADETVTPHHEAYSVVKSIEFDTNTWTNLVQFARDKGIAVFACTYDVPSVQLAVDTKCDGIKLNSADLSNPDVLKAVAESGIPFTLGTGASTLDEIRAGLTTLQEFGAENVVLMHGVQNFPTAKEDLNINRLELLRKEFPNIPVGYADHTDGDNPFSQVVDLLAVAKGVALIEKHITLDRSQKGIDYQAALEPEEYINFVERIRNGFVALGTKEELPFTASDLKYRKFQKKSVVAARDISAGEVLKREDVLFIRNVEPGIPPKDFNLIEGKTITVGIDRFQNIDESNVNLG